MTVPEPDAPINTTMPIQPISPPSPSEPEEDLLEVEEAFPGRIGIITNAVEQNEEEFHSAEALQLKYGSDKVIHRIWPTMFSEEGEMMISIMEEIASDPEIEAVIINQAVINTNAAVDRFRELRKDEVFMVYCSPAEDTEAIATRADLIFDINYALVGEIIVQKAMSMGAEAIIHFSYQRHMSVPQISSRRDIMMTATEREGIDFIDITVPDPMAQSHTSMSEYPVFIANTVQKLVEERGANIAFYATSCAMQIPLINQIFTYGAIFPMQCCPSPYHGIPTALGIQDKIMTGQFDPQTGAEITRLQSLSDVIEVSKQVIADRGLSGRISTWAVPASMLWTTIGTEYAIEWINGGVSRQAGEIDLGTLYRLGNEYIESFGIDSEGFSLATYDADGVRYGHYVRGLVGFLTY